MALQLWILVTQNKIKFAHQACQHQSPSLPSQGWSQYMQLGKALLCQLAGIILSDLTNCWQTFLKLFISTNVCQDKFKSRLTYSPLHGHCISNTAVQTYTEDARTTLLTASSPRTFANSSKTLPLAAQFPVKSERETLI